MSDEHNFDDAFRKWASRQTPTGPPDAARAVVEQMSVEQGFSLAGRRLSPAWATLALAIVAIVGGTASFIRSLPAPETRTSALTAAYPTTVPARGADLILWLDDDTTVYVFLPGDSQAMR